MADLSFLLSRALTNGRTPGAARSREAILAALLRKRAAAHRHGCDGQEQQLREQIRWALPIHDPREPADP